MNQNKIKTVLIVEDDAPQLLALKEKFSREGFTVLASDNGQQGLAVALAEKPDIILLDIVMPVMDGLTMLKQLRKHPWGRAKVVLLTNLSDGKNIVSGIDSQVFDYLVKSDWGIQDVVSLVKNRVGLPV